LRSRGRRDRVLRTKEVGIVVRPGDVFLVESGGGGGYGDPRQRAPEARAYDRENGFVTRGSDASRSRRPTARVRSPARPTRARRRPGGARPPRRGVGAPPPRRTGAAPAPPARRGNVARATGKGR